VAGEWYSKGKQKGGTSCLLMFVPNSGADSLGTSFVNISGKTDSLGQRTVAR
jgi:hypothetical protein